MCRFCNCVSELVQGPVEAVLKVLKPKFGLVVKAILFN